MDIENKSIKERYEHLLALIGSERFLKKQGIGNEVPFYICPYQPTETVGMEKIRVQLRNRLEQNGIQVLDVNLYDLSIAILKDRGLWESIIEREVEVEKEQLKELLQGVLDSETHLVPAIAKRMAEVPYDVMFLSGVGEVYPYIRSHNVLNNLQSTAKDKPTVLFFPGEYTYSLEEGASLDLFGCLHDDKYYRAFNIYHCEI